MKIYLFIIFVLFMGEPVMARGKQESFHKTVETVDLSRFSGDWYVIALIPTSFEKNAVNGIENYSLDAKGRIRVKYTFYQGSPQGKKKIMYQKGWIYNNKTYADWRVQPLWPFRLPYYILELDKDYQYTVIGTNNYKYLWIMAREPVLDEPLLAELYQKMEIRGFDPGKIQRMTQEWEK